MIASMASDDCKRLQLSVLREKPWVLQGAEGQKPLVWVRDQIRGHERLFSEHRSDGSTVNRY